MGANDSKSGIGTWKSAMATIGNSSIFPVTVHAMKTARVNKRGAMRVRQGHLWIYKSDVVEVDADGGSIVCVTDEGGNLIGQALYSGGSQVVIRFWPVVEE